MGTSALPEIRLILSFDGVTPAYVVFKTDKGWVGAPGLKRGQYLTDEDVKDGVPYVPEAWTRPALRQSATAAKVKRIAMSLDGHFALERLKPKSRADTLMLWRSMNGGAYYDDDEVVELTEYDSVEAGKDDTRLVADFLGSRHFGIKDAASAEPYYSFREGDFEGEIWLYEGTRVWRTDNVFYVLPAATNHFHMKPRVRNF